jgi:predicted peptidase
MISNLQIIGGAKELETGFLNREIRLNSITYRYQVYLPREWKSESKWPIILFLHGSGERGDDGHIQTEVGIGTAIRRNVSRFPCVVLFPQCRDGMWWSMPQMKEQVMAILNQSIKEFNGDEQRIYLTGISMGGYGTWDIGAEYPDRFAALVPVCGGVELPSKLSGLSKDNELRLYRRVAEKVKGIPTWIFHGEEDDAVPVTESRRMHEALSSLKADVRYTEYKGVGHNSWDRAYAEEELYSWVFSQRLADR